MTDDSAGQASPGYQGAAEPAADLKTLDKLVGTWELSGDVGGTVTYEWMKGGFFLIQRVHMVQEDGQENTGIEIIGHERGMGAEPSADIKSRFYSDSGDTLDYVYELEGDTLTIWFGERGSPVLGVLGGVPVAAAVLQRRRVEGVDRLAAGCVERHMRPGGR
jgi:hypothetical protein